MPEVGEPTLDQLRVLAVVADEGSFSAAARVLGRAQSVISYTVGQLEAQLGLALFERGGRAPVLTEAGRALVADARRVGGLVQELRARALALRQGTEAEVSLAVDVMFPVSRGGTSAVEGHAVPGGYSGATPTATTDTSVAWASSAASGSPARYADTEVQAASPEQ